MKGMFCVGISLVRSILLYYTTITRQSTYVYIKLATYVRIQVTLFSIGLATSSGQEKMAPTRPFLHVYLTIAVISTHNLHTVFI